MAKFIDLTGQTFNQLTVIKELGGGKVLCRCTCGNEVECYKKNVKSGKVKSCGCQNKDYSLFGKTINNLTVIRELGGGKVLCRCICGKTIECWKKNVKSGIVQSCGCVKNDRTKTMVNPSNKYIGAVFGELTVIRSNSDRTVTCRCSCGKEIDTYIQTLNKGHMTTCGHDKLRNTIVGREFGELTVIERLNAQKVKCRCSCGNIKEYYVSHLLDGTTKSCGCKKLRYKIVGERFGYWTVTKSIDAQTVEVKCDCGTVRNVYIQTLVRGQSRSCGCKSRELSKQLMLDKYNEICTLKIDEPREKWQIEALESKENFENAISKLKIKNINTVKELLNINTSTAHRYIQKFGLGSQIGGSSEQSSYIEDEIYGFVQELGAECVRHNRGLISPYELDIYIPDKKIAIEVNGSYWHSDKVKDKNYHYNKTRLCRNLGIRLIHIFDYEWVTKNNLIKGMLIDALKPQTTIYARNCIIKQIDNSTAKEFEEQYHLSGGVNSKLNIGIFNEDTLVGVVALGDNRFSTYEAAEIYRICFKTGYRVVGGISKAISHIFNNYDISTIITYSDLSKFSGEAYERVGFKKVAITEPNYVWVEPDKFIVVSRYQSQKHKLIEKGLGNESQTEAEIMESYGFIRVYDCGNQKYVLIKEDI